MAREKAANRWRRVIGEQDASGQDVREFCSERGVRTSSFYWWRKRLGLNKSIDDGKRRTSVKGSGGFQRIDPSTVIEDGNRTFSAEKSPKAALERRCLILTPNGYRVEAGCGDADELRQVLAMLKTL